MKYFDKKVQFNEAEKFCESNNSTLTSIHSAEENEFIRSYVKKQPSYPEILWIGLKRNISGSKEFVWVDKSLVDYVKWDIDQPDKDFQHYRQEKKQLHIFMRIDKNGAWNDRTDIYSAFSAFVCGFNCK